MEQCLQKMETNIIFYIAVSIYTNSYLLSPTITLLNNKTNYILMQFLKNLPQIH